MPKKKTLTDETEQSLQPTQEVKDITPIIEELTARVSVLETQVKELLGQQQHKDTLKKEAVSVPLGIPIKWKKIGGGSFRMTNGAIIKQNQIFTATVEQIPPAFRDIIVPVDGEQALEQPVKTSPMYRLEDKGAGWFDVVNIGTEKVINEKGLRKEDAEKLLQDLS